MEVTSVINGLNQATSVGGNAVAYDAENYMPSGNGATLSYDAAGRLYETSKSGYTTTRRLYAGSALIAEYDTSGTVLRRYVHGRGSSSGNAESSDDDPCANSTVEDCIVVTATRTRRFSDGSRIRLGNTGAEQAFTVDSGGIFPLGDDLYSEIEQECDDGSSRTGLAINRNAFGGSLGGHTHPRSVDGVRIDQLPGPRDGGLARALGAAYIISNRGAFRIDYSGGQFSASLIYGRPLKGTERAAVSSLVGRWNQHGGGGGVRCRTVSR